MIVEKLYNVKKFIDDLEGLGFEIYYVNSNDGDSKKIYEDNKRIIYINYEYMYIDYIIK